MEWSECYSKSRKRPYWFNTKTGESVWDLSKVVPHKKRKITPIVLAPTDEDHTLLEIKEALDFLEPILNNPQISYHYDQLTEKTPVERNLSHSIYLRNLNNWIKIVLISESVNLASQPIEYHPEESQCSFLNVGDFACGRGGDLSKWSHHPVRDYHGVDLSSESIKNSIKRYESKSYPFHAKFYVQDLSTPLQIDCGLHSLDIISMQFALHYLFKSESHVRCLLRSISNYLRKGGIFMFTTVDAHCVYKMLNDKDENLQRIGITRSITSDVVSLETPIMNLSMKRKVADKWKTHSLDFFGMSYTFSLADSVSECEEYVVQRSVIESLAQEYKLKPLLCQNFHQYYYAHANRYMDLFKKMVGYDHTSHEWHTSGLYCVYMFQAE